MSVGTKSGASGKVYRTVHYANVPNDGNAVEAQEDATEDRTIHGATSMFDHVNSNDTAEWEMNAFLGTPDDAAAAVNLTAGNADYNNGTTMLFDHGYSQVNDATNGVGLGAGLQTRDSHFPWGVEWDENQTLTTRYWNGTNSASNADMRVIYHYTER